MYLLDTCAFLYYLEDNPKLSEKSKSIIESDNLLYLSQTTLWEIAIKKTIHKLNLGKSTYELEELCSEGGIEIIPIKNSYFETIQKLPYIHGDPFDRLIIATAVDEELQLLTDDETIVKYPNINVIW